MRVRVLFDAHARNPISVNTNYELSKCCLIYVLYLQCGVLSNGSINVDK